MNIKILLLKSPLIIMGEINVTDDSVFVRNPVEVITKSVGDVEQSGFAISFAPIFHYAQESKEEGVRFLKSEIISEMTPIEELKEHYTKHFKINE
jgi:hypothetical protein